MDPEVATGQRNFITTVEGIRVPTGQGLGSKKEDTFGSPNHRHEDEKREKLQDCEGLDYALHGHHLNRLLPHHGMVKVEIFGTLGSIVHRSYRLVPATYTS